jgi:hypothetical protein
VRAFAIAMALVVASACSDDVDPPWQLDHDRIIAIRATPPRILPGERAEIDLLLGQVDQPPLEMVPATASVAEPASLASVLTREADRWVVTAPSADQIAAVRVEMALPADAPVPVRIALSIGELAGLKTVWLGEHRDNPTLGAIMVNETDVSASTSLSVGAEVDVPVAVAFDDENFDINWLTSCGTMHDFDLPSAYLRVEPDDPFEGWFAVVVRDAFGGVAWKLWPIQAEPPSPE